MIGSKSHSFIIILLVPSPCMLFPYSSLSHCIHTFARGDRQSRRWWQFRGLLWQKYCFVSNWIGKKKEGTGEAV